MTNCFMRAARMCVPTPQALNTIVMNVASTMLLVLFRVVVPVSCALARAVPMQWMSLGGPTSSDCTAELLFPEGRSSCQYQVARVNNQSIKLSHEVVTYEYIHDWSL